MCALESFRGEKVRGWRKPLSAFVDARIEMIAEL
jgi:hypothetical protein